MSFAVTIRRHGADGAITDSARSASIIRTAMIADARFLKRITVGTAVMPTELTVKELAERERVTRRTVYHWIEKGAVETRKTPGGGVRIVDRRAAGSREPVK
jgi:excisionase family DNA binding protein